jgi:radical SAM enzyme (TIGR01210 family)
MNLAAGYPSTRVDRDRFVVDRRGPRPRYDPWRHQGVVVEDELAADGRLVRAATIFLTGRECPWRCVMCDLWQHTIALDTPPGALVRQLDDGLQTLLGEGALPDHVKLYNAGSFFDPRAVPECDYAAIAQRLSPFAHVVVEAHPALVGDRLVRFGRALADAGCGRHRPTLEVAMGLETAHPEALDRLNKGFTTDQFAAAAERLHQHGASLRTFLLVGVPFISRSHQQESIARSVSFAFDCGSSVVSLIPTRPGNGALEALGVAPPTLRDLETALERALQAPRGRVFADLWDLHRFASCKGCFHARHDRLRRMNHDQRLHPPVHCADCASAAADSAS